jgi:hypothetical protein
LPSSKKQSKQFSHPAEEMFATILDFYGISWEYEPRTFVLEKDSEGRPLLAFSPDFYLPDQDLYIELTTLRPKLTNLKNKKLKLMGELFPDVNIKLIKRREMRNLMVKYGLYSQADVIQGTQAQRSKQTQEKEK